MPEFFPWPWPYPSSPGAQFEIEPQNIYANATMRFVKLFTQFPAGLWTLEYGMVPYAGATTGPITFKSTQLNGSEFFLIDVPPTVTKLWIPGKYSWQCFAKVTDEGVTVLGIDPSTRIFISRGTIIIDADLTTVGATDTRTKWQKILDEIDAMILATAGDTQQEISMGRGTIAGQSIKGWTRQDLINFRDYAAHQASNDTRIQARKGGAPNPRVKYAVMGGGGSGYAGNGFPDYPAF